KRGSSRTTRSLLIHFYLSNFKGFRKLRHFDFTDSNKAYDVVLIIQGKKLYLNKQMLSLHSPVFHTMFSSNFDEKNKK
ncbi:hypothetical protein PENTCL1PPCAC_19307, partial [Pristionchus entomophagus]